VFCQVFACFAKPAFGPLKLSQQFWGNLYGRMWAKQSRYKRALPLMQQKNKPVPEIMGTGLLFKHFLSAMVKRYL